MKSLKAVVSAWATVSEVLNRFRATAKEELFDRADEFLEQLVRDYSDYKQKATEG